MGNVEYYCQFNSFSNAGRIRVLGWFYVNSKLRYCQDRWSVLAIGVLGTEMEGTFKVSFSTKMPDIYQRI
jgi:hypothetical protein